MGRVPPDAACIALGYCYASMRPGANAGINGCPCAAATSCRPDASMWPGADAGINARVTTGLRGLRRGSFNVVYHPITDIIGRTSGGGRLGLVPHRINSPKGSLRSDRAIPDSPMATRTHCIQAICEDR